MTRASADRLRGGFTLVEAALSFVLLAVLLAGLALVTRSTSGAFRSGMAEDDVFARSHRALEFLTAELAEAERGTLAPLPAPGIGSSTLTYRIPTGYAGGAVQWSAPRTFALQLDGGELDDGVDNDGDGLTDEMDLVWTVNVGQPDELTTTRCHDVSEYLEGEVGNVLDDNGNGLVDEPGLTFLLEGDVLTITLSVERVSDGRVYSKIVRTSVRVRN